jgi:hypothetical protein
MQVDMAQVHDSGITPRVVCLTATSVSAARVHFCSWTRSPREWAGSSSKATVYGTRYSPTTSPWVRRYATQTRISWSTPTHALAFFIFSSSFSLVSPIGEGGCRTVWPDVVPLWTVQYRLRFHIHCCSFNSIEYILTNFSSCLVLLWPMLTMSHNSVTVQVCRVSCSCFPFFFESLSLYLHVVRLIWEYEIFKN